MKHRRGWRIVVVVSSLSFMLSVAVSELVAAPAEVPLIEAVRGGDTDATRALLAESVDVNQLAADGATALHWAVHRDDLELVGLLLDAGADVDVANRYGVQ
ncbi:MAG: ankyrin repeat domain-containing protein, partial [Gemmatimonadales bacterium]